MTPKSLVKHLTQLRKSGRYRRETGRAVVIGKKLVSDLLKTHKPVTLLKEESPEILTKIAGREAGHEWIAEFELPTEQKLSGRRLLALDGVSDPGNLGTLLRTALAFGWEGVYLLPGCADPFGDKVLRASQGAMFHLPYCHAKTVEGELLVAHTDGEPLEALEAPQECILVLGSEGQGPSPELLERGRAITIPIHQVESLNVAAAGAIFMHSLRTVHA
jgi:RNA methyltransferase, TrmH family